MFVGLISRKKSCNYTLCPAGISNRAFRIVAGTFYVYPAQRTRSPLAAGAFQEDCIARKKTRITLAACHCLDDYINHRRRLTDFPFQTEQWKNSKEFDRRRGSKIVLPPTGQSNSIIIGNNSLARGSRSFPFHFAAERIPKGFLPRRTDICASRAQHTRAHAIPATGETGGEEEGVEGAEEQSHRFKLKSGNTREGETFAGLSGLITPGTDSI